MVHRCNLSQFNFGNGWERDMDQETTLSLKVAFTKVER